MQTAHTALLVICLAVALGFEFANGFHDTANAVATVIYTRALRPWVAVIWSGLCNFAGVFIGGIAVAMSIIKLLPAELVASRGVGLGLAMVLSMLLAAILWNIGTWYFGLPSSSSHTLIGAILGVGVANSMRAGHQFGHGVNWSKAGEVGMSLLLSPMFGFVMAALVLLLLQRLVPDKRLHSPAKPGEKPPGWIRAVLVGTCTGVSFAHGSNDGQKGVGLIMLILIATMPGAFAVNRALSHDQIMAAAAAADDAAAVVRSDVADGGQARAELVAIGKQLRTVKTFGELPDTARLSIRARILAADTLLGAAEKKGAVAKTDAAVLKKARATLRSVTDYAPPWVLIAVALALGLGTMIGWKRIVVTVGEKIGKEHITYAQGASAELVAMTTIGLSAFAGLPVSTTHVLSSGIAGTMVARRSGLQPKTVRSIALAWLLTLPATMILSATFFLILERFFKG